MKHRTLLALAMTTLFIASLTSGCSRAPAAEESSIVEASEGDTEEEVARDYERGQWDDDGVYTNDYLDLTFQLPTGWVAATEEEIMNSMELGAVYLNDTQKAKAEMAKLSSIYDMAISSPSAQATVSLMAENLAMSLGGTSLDEEDYASLMAEQLGATDLPYVVGEFSYRQIGGDEYLLMPAQVEGMSTVQWLFFRRSDNYMISFIASFVSGGEADMEALFDSMTMM